MAIVGGALMPKLIGIIIDVGGNGVSDVQNKKLKNNSTVLYWHTGSLSANFYSSEVLL